MARLEKLERIGRRGDLLAIFLMIFCADVSIGAFRATFSLFASSVGATVAMIGVMGSMEGLANLLLAVPVGVLSDKKDRRTVLGGGLLLFAFLYALCTVVRTPVLLYPIRAMSGLAVASTFYVGLAFVSDIVEERDRGLCIGIYTSCMGVGFAIGSAIGGRLAEDIGFAAGFRFAVAAVLVSFAILRFGPARQSVLPRPVRVGRAQPTGTRISRLLRRPRLLAASLGQLGIAMVNEGAIFNFFPLYAASLSLSKAVIGGLFSVRTLASAAARLPTGALVARLTSKRLMIAAVALSMTSLTLIPFGQTAAVLGLFLAGEGIAFGMYFAAGTAAVAENTTEANRGTATGMFTMAGGIGTTLGPLGLGAAAGSWGLNSVFWLTAAVLLAALVISLFLYSRTGSVAPEPARSSPET